MDENLMLSYVTPTSIKPYLHLGNTLTNPSSFPFSLLRKIATKSSAS